MSNRQVRPTREDILQKARAVHLKLGKTPGVSTFCQIAGLRPADIHYYWPRYADLVAEVGGTPNQMASAIPDELVFQDYARVCLHVGRVPTRNELRIATRQLGTRTHRIYDRFGAIAEFDRRFRQWLGEGPEEFRVILSFPGWDRRSGRMLATLPHPTPDELAVTAFHPFLPATLQFLDALSLGHLPPHEPADSSVNVLFERRCADAFRCLGFEVADLGQGKGRAADALAIARREGFAVIIDAKVRTNGYVLGTDDRTFIEYATTHARQLAREAIDKVYLVVIGSSFRQRDLERLTEYLTDAPIRSVDLITAKALIQIVEESIRDRCRFALSDIDRRLFGNKIIDV